MRITAHDVELIRALRDDGMPIRVIAEKFCVSESTIEYHIYQRYTRNWKKSVVLNGTLRSEAVKMLDIEGEATRERFIEHLHRPYYRVDNVLYALMRDGVIELENGKYRRSW